MKLLDLTFTILIEINIDVTSFTKKMNNQKQENFAKKVLLFPVNFFKDKLGKNSSFISKVIGIIVFTIYLVSPIDLIPDFIPLFGQSDDLIILISMLVGIGSSYIGNQNNEEIKVKKINLED